MREEHDSKKEELNQNKYETKDVRRKCEFFSLSGCVWYVFLSVQRK